jgi:hypothetical protein
MEKNEAYFAATKGGVTLEGARELSNTPEDSTDGNFPFFNKNGPRRLEWIFFNNLSVTASYSDHYEQELVFPEVERCDDDDPPNCETCPETTDEEVWDTDVEWEHTFTRQSLEQESLEEDAANNKFFIQMTRGDIEPEDPEDGPAVRKATLRRIEKVFSEGTFGSYTQSRTTPSRSPDSCGIEVETTASALDLTGCSFEIEFYQASDNKWFLFWEFRSGIPLGSSPTEWNEVTFERVEISESSITKPYTRTYTNTFGATSPGLSGGGTFTMSFTLS